MILALVFGSHFNTYNYHRFFKDLITTVKKNKISNNDTSHINFFSKLIAVDDYSGRSSYLDELSSAWETKTKSSIKQNKTQEKTRLRRSNAEKVTSFTAGEITSAEH